MVCNCGGLSGLHVQNYIAIQVRKHSTVKFTSTHLRKRVLELPCFARGLNGTDTASGIRHIETAADHSRRELGRRRVMSKCAG